MEIHPRLEIQTRDLEILSQIFESPACTRSQIALTLFEGRYEAAKKRLQQLHRAGFIENNDSSSTGRSILKPTNAGLEILGAQPRMLGSVPRRMHRHEMMLADVLASFNTAASRRSFLPEFTTGSESAFCVFCSEHARDESVNPDAFLALKGANDDSSQHFFFVEVDRSTETQGHLTHLGKQYQAHQRSGGFAAKLGHAYEPKRVPFRVLLVVKSRERLLRTGQNLRASARIGTLVWIGVLSDVLNDPFGPIWFCPLDFDGSSPFRSPRTLF